jgi:hypothetical protein
MKPLEDLVPPAKNKGDPLPPESVRLREELKEAHRERVRRARLPPPPLTELERAVLDRDYYRELLIQVAHGRAKPNELAALLEQAPSKV